VPDSSGRAPYRLWGARFERGGLAPEAEALNRSFPVDARLWREELEAEAAWAEALGMAGVLAPEEVERVRAAIGRLAESAASAAGGGTDRAVPPDEGDEDVHTWVERRIAEEAGAVASKMRAGRSRNDRAATALRLWTLRALDGLDAELAGLQAALVAQAEATVDALLPAYTHLQRAQPVRVAHWFLSHVWPLQRDRERFRDARARTSVLPLGAGAAAGSGIPVDRERLRARLGFDRVSPNSLDAVGDRDFVAEVVAAAALTGVHLSRLAEDLVLFASAEFGFVRFDDAYSTGSSLLPQKRNPDVAELARGKSARLVGDAAAVLVLLKGLPAGYQKDLQEDKAILFDAVDTLRAVLPAMAGAVRTLRWDAEASARACDASLLAADVADALVRGGRSFAEAHAVVGRLVREAESRGAGLLDVPAELAAALDPALPAALAEVAAGPARSVERRTVEGGTAREAVLRQLDAARALVARS
jgi:argininosuccinate lyase